MSILAKLDVDAQELPLSNCEEAHADINFNFSKGAKLKSSMDSLTGVGIPGVSMAIYSNEGWWTGASGYAQIETKTLMEPCHLMYLQSIAKTYMAVAILQLYEQGIVDIDGSIASYLPRDVAKMISNVEKISVRMLLSHTSGIPEYNSAPAYITKLLQEPSHYFEPRDYIKYIEGKRLDFTPGSRYSYRNTNFVLLALIADNLIGDHAAYISKEIFRSLDLRDTYYRSNPGYLRYPQLVNTYWDRHSDGVIENVSVLQRNNVLAMVGDDGIVATPADAVKFLKGLMEGDLIDSGTLAMMKDWVVDKNNKPTYGLGLDIEDFAGYSGIGHSGGGIGAGCQLYYFPDKDLYIFIGINLGTVTGSPIQNEATSIVENIFRILLE